MRTKNQEPRTGRRKFGAGATAAALATAVLLTGCSNNNFRDVEGVESNDPDSIRSWNNLDGHPNIARVCLDGVAFATTTRDVTSDDSVNRVPEWDKFCPEPVSEVLTPGAKG